MSINKNVGPSMRCLIKANAKVRISTVVASSLKVVVRCINNNKSSLFYFQQMGNDLAITFSPFSVKFSLNSSRGSDHKRRYVKIYVDVSCGSAESLKLQIVSTTAMIYILSADRPTNQRRRRRLIALTWNFVGLTVETQWLPVANRYSVFDTVSHSINK